MIDLYYWATPNGWKVTILLEELALPYQVIPVNIMAGEQFAPEFLKISPNNKIPAIVDHDGPDGEAMSLFDSVVIMQYLAKKTGRFLPKNEHDLWQMRQWLAFQMAHIGPMLGQTHHFLHYAPEKIDYAITRYSDEASRLYGVLDRRLAESEWLAGDELTIADFATFPWILPYKYQGQDIANYPHVQRWYDTLKVRPALRRGIDVGKESAEASRKNIKDMDQATRQNLFGNKLPKT